MKLFLLIFLSFGSLFCANTDLIKDDRFAFNLPAESLKFTYKNFDGDLTYNCRHKKINAFYDWEVYCGDRGQRIFRVHLFLARYGGPNRVKTMFEFLYWITNEQTKESTGTTQFFRLNNKTEFDSLLSSQATDNDTAGLYLEVSSL